MGELMKILNALIEKEYHQILRDPSSLIIAFALPLMLIFIFAYGVNLDTNKSNLGLLNEDLDGKEFASSISGTKYIKVFNYNNRAHMVDDLIAKKIDAIMIIPSDFSSKLKSPFEIANVQVITDGTETNSAVFVNSYILGSIANWQKIYSIENGEKYKTLIDIQTSAWFNKDLNGLNTMLSSSIATIMSLIGILLTALVLAREWERGTMESLLSTRVRKIDIILGKYIPYYILTMISTLLCFIVCVFGFDVPFRGSFLMFLISGSFFILASIGEGLLISAITKNQFLSCIIAASIGLLPSMLLSGAIFPISSMPIVFQWLTYIVPARYFIPIIQNLFLAETMWNIVIPQTIYLFISSVIFFILVYRSFNEKLE